MLGFIYLYGKDKPVDYDKAYYFISNAYKLGKQEIDYALGLCYYKIKERYQDNKEKYLYIFKLAVKHLSLAANRNNVEAQYLLARIMLTNGAEKNDEYALSLFESAYKNGKKEAASYLANMYFEGIGTEKDLRKALFYYEIDAYLGNPEAALKCARLYNQGFGNNSLDKAFDYYNQIKDKYPQEAYYALGVISKKRGDLKSAHKYFKKAVDNKSKEANYELALTYKNGLGTDVDNKSAFVYFSHASIFGEPKAIFEVARSFDEGIGTNVDKVKALQYYTAVENEFPICYYYIGMIWFNGVGVEKSLEKAFKNFEKGVEYSEPNCLNKLGDLYYNGLIVERDFVKAIRFYDQAKDSKHKDAIYSLGYMHYYGIGFKVNKPKGIDLFKLAYKLGSYDALYELAIIELENENKKEAIKMLKEASKKGVVKATRELGLLKKSHSNKYFKEAAQKGDGISIYHIALSLGKTKKAMELFQKSFELGINEAGYNAGIIAYKLRNYGLAIQYLSNQASESHYQAYFALADIYKNGRTVPKDLDRARFYYEIGSTLKSEARR